MAYRSSRIHARPGTEIIRPVQRESRSRRLWNAAADMAALPIVALRRRKVTVGERSLPLHYGFRRWAWRSERCVELALGQDALRRWAPSDVLEVGNVLSTTGHTVVDKYEVGPGVLNVDIVDFAPGRRYGLVVCLSTLEHIGWDEEPRDPDKAARALQVMSDLGDSLLVTIPVGYHRQLEPQFVEGPFDKVVLLAKRSRLAGWRQEPLTALPLIEYGYPYAGGNGVLIGMRGMTRA